MSRLGNTPFFNTEEPEEPAKKKSGSQAGLPENYTRATFILRCDLLEKLKDCAYTDRLSIKEAINEAIELYLEDRDDLLERRKK